MKKIHAIFGSLSAFLLVAGCGMNNPVSFSNNNGQTSQFAAAAPASNEVMVQWQPSVNIKTCYIGTLSSTNTFTQKGAQTFPDSIVSVMVNHNRRILVITTKGTNLYYNSGILNTDCSVTWQQSRLGCPMGLSWRQSFSLNASGQVVETHINTLLENKIHIYYGQIQSDGSLIWMSNISWQSNNTFYAWPNSIALNDRGSFVIFYNTQTSAGVVFTNYWSNLCFLAGQVSGNTINCTGAGTIRSGSDCHVDSYATLDNTGMVIEFEHFDGGDTRLYLRVGTISGNSFSPKSFKAITNNGTTDYPTHVSTDYTFGPYKTILSYWSVANKKSLSYIATIDPASGTATINTSFILQWEGQTFPGSLFPYAPNTWYKLLSRNNPSLALDADNAKGPVGDGSNVQVWTCSPSGHANQQWQFIDNRDGYCHIINRENQAVGLDANINTGKVDNGTNVQVWTWGAQANKQWLLVFDADGYCGILSKGVNLGLDADIAKGPLHDGSNVQLYTYGGAGHTNQQWLPIAVP